MKILIVEDMFIEAFDLELILSGHGYEVTGIAHTAADAYAMVCANCPDLVCLDIFLRGDETGISIAQRLQKMGIGFVFISANTYAHIDEKAQTLNPYGFITKPFRDQDVIPVIEAAMNVCIENKKKNQ